ncbi:MAG: CBS domain-containing protein [Elusimicrobia bacterium]|nr:CBS domain-containing protein [Elusimicrobiota bacterium]
MKCPDCAAENIPGSDVCVGCGHDLPDPARRLPKGDLAERVRKGTIASLGPRPAVSVPYDRTVADAVDLMREEKVGALLITKAGKVVGILTERDALREVAGLKDPAKVPVSAVMHADPDTLRADEPVTHAFHHMSVGGYRHMPVLLDDGSVAMVSSRDLLSYLAASD